MPRGGDRGGRKPRLPDHLKRRKLHDFRLPQWQITWLKSHPRQGSRMIERALLETYGAEMTDYHTQKHTSKTSLSRI